MNSVLRLCPKCRSEIPTDAPEGGCPGCLLENGLGLLLYPPVADGDASTVTLTEVNDGSSAQNVEENAAAAARQNQKAARSAQILGELGDYELLEEISRGGQGVVFRARQKSLNRTVALKVISVGQWARKADLKRFRREALASASLDHPGIVPIYEVGEHDGSCYFSMKFVQGGQLDDVTKREPMSIRHAAELIAKVARTVHYAHEHGILHRDIKPGNILLDAKGEPLLADFGLARLTEFESTVTRTMEVMGTPSYMAPEQAVGNNAGVSSATDVYGLGAVLYQLLTGHPPFAGGTTYETIKLVLDTEPRRPRLWNRKIDRDLSTICLKCLEKDPKRRYSSALTLAEDLEHWLKHEPIRAKRSGFFTHARKWMQRKPATAVLIASLAALAAALGWNVWKSELIRRPVANGIAVLPFENLSPDQENAFFADGVQDQILTNLAKIADLKVISRTSVMQYKTGVKRNLREIANALGVAHVVEGSVQRAANRVRVSAQLIDARTDAHLWAERYDRDLADVFAIQSEIAKAVADQLQAKLSPREKAAIEQQPTADLAAYDRYVRAKALLIATSDARQGEYLYQAVRLLEQAISRDPAFLLAYCKLAFAHQELYYAGFDHSARRLALANEALKKALELGPDRGEAHLAAVWVHYHCYLDYDRARGELAIARSMLPNDPDVFALAGYMDRRQGRWKEHIQNLERATQVDPRNIDILQNLAQGYQLLRQFPDMAAVWDRILAVTPADALMRVARASVDFEWRADTSRAHAVIHDVIAEDPNAGAAFAEDWLFHAICERNPVEIRSALTFIPREGTTPVTVRICRPFYQGLAARALNDTIGAKSAFLAARAEMEKIIEEEPDYPQALSVLGMSDAALGRKEDALREARRAVELFPRDKDPLTYAELIKNLAVVYAWTGEKEAALSELKGLLQIPAPISYGQLRLHPYWDPLRGDPRFDQLVVESTKPIAIK